MIYECVGPSGPISEKCADKDCNVAKKIRSKKTAKPKKAKKTVVKKAKPRKSAVKTVKKAGKAATKKPAPAKRKAGKKPARKSPLTKPQLKELRGSLVQKRKALLGDMAGIEDQAIGKGRQNGSGDLSNMPTHPADIGSDNYEQEFTLGLLESERALLQEINEAIERIDNGVYGVCLGTGQRIGIARLRARPWAKHCIGYARLVEKGLVQPNEEDEEELD